MTAPPEHPLRWLWDRAERIPHVPAIVGEGYSLSYRQLRDCLGGWSRVMASAGLASGQATAIVTGSRARVARAVWLAMHDGLPLLTMNPSQPRAAALMQQCGVTQAITDAELPLPEGIRRLPARSLDRDPNGPAEPPTPMRLGQPQLLVPTSGTERSARAVMLTSRNIFSAAFPTNRLLGLGQGDCWLCCLPLTHVAGIMILMRCAAAGATVLLQEKFDPGRIAEALAREEVKFISLVPAMLHRLIEAGVDPSPLKVALVGGSGMPDHLARRALAAGWPVSIAYGLTETCAHVAVGDLALWGRALTPQTGTRIEIVDGRNQPAEGAGRIRVTGPTVMAGYANPKLTPGEGLAGQQSFLTEDLGRIDGDGLLHVIGRGDDVLISGGINIHPAQVEDLMTACPGISEVAVIGVPDPVWGARLVALYCGDAEEGAVQNWAARNIASPMRPREFRKVAALPRTPLGKLRRRDLGRLV